MAWVRLDDGYPEHPKVDRVGPLAAWLNVCAWAYCARNLTDGFVPAERIGRLADVPNAAKLAKALVAVKLWEPCEGGYMVHDYLSYNPSRDQVLSDRSKTAERVAEHRKRVSNGVTPPDGNGVTSPVTNGRSTDVGNGVSTTAPYPSRTRSLKAASQLKAPADEFTTAEQEVIDAVGVALAEFGFSLAPRLWRKVLSGYPEIDLEAEAYKQADWLKRNRIKNCSATRYTNWLDKAHPKVVQLGQTRRIIDKTGTVN